MLPSEVMSHHHLFVYLHLFPFATTRELGLCGYSMMPREVSWCHSHHSHPAKFGGHRHCVSGNKMVLAYHVISQDHVIKGSYSNDTYSYANIQMK